MTKNKKKQLRFGFKEFSLAT